MNLQKNVSSTQDTVQKIVNGNCIEEMKKMPAGCVDMIFADPPYNLQLSNSLLRPDNSKVEGVTNDWDKFNDFKAYDDFSSRWLSEAYRILNPEGTLWVIGSYHNIFRVGKILQDIGFWILNDIIWRKSNPMPNFRGRRFTNAHETLIWCSKGKDAKYTFNYDSMKALNEDLQMRSDWFLPLCTGKERLKDKNGSKAHPTQKPESLLHRVIIASTNAGDIVLDPFSGTGTTGAVARKLGRNFLGFEADEKYTELSRERLGSIEPLKDQDAFNSISQYKKEKPRIPFGWLVENGILEPGTSLVDQKKRFEAKVSADGSLYAKTGKGISHRGSIHKVGAELQGAPSCNGWTFWYARHGQKWVPIDYFRENMRKKMVDSARV